MAKGPKIRFVCQACGADSPRWFGRCPSCEAWNSLVEEVAPAEVAAALGGGKGPRAARGPAPVPLAIAEVDVDEGHRIATGFSEFDRVLGGGVVPGSLILLGGDPGIGKSTLLLQASEAIAKAGHRVLYASGEESARQIALRAKRLGVVHPNLLVLAEPDVTQVLAAIEQESPAWVVVDSVQAVHDPEASGLPGSVSQVRASAGAFMRTAKAGGAAICLVGHVTKEGTLAGPRVLEHMVDAVLTFEGDRHHRHRVLRGVKNRFGATHEVGLFEMAHGGLEEVDNPSALFLAERDPTASGSAVVPTLEGTRPLLVEVQALVAATNLAQPRRSAQGIENGRLVQILAVLEKRLGLPMGRVDVYLNVVGGLSIGEPAADLAVSLAVASSLRELPLPPDLVAIGELGLNGEVRAVANLAPRLVEAAALGFKRAVVPRHGWDPSLAPPGLEVRPVAKLVGAIVAALGEDAGASEPSAADWP